MGAGGVWGQGLPGRKGQWLLLFKDGIHKAAGSTTHRAPRKRARWASSSASQSCATSAPANSWTFPPPEEPACSHPNLLLSGPASASRSELRSTFLGRHKIFKTSACCDLSSLRQSKSHTLKHPSQKQKQLDVECGIVPRDELPDCLSGGEGAQGLETGLPVFLTFQVF